MTGISIRILFSADFVGYPNTDPEVSSEILRLYNGVGKFASVEAIPGEPGVCKFLEFTFPEDTITGLPWKVIAAEYLCPITSVWLTDYVGLLIGLVLAVYIIVVVTLACFGNYSAWETMNISFGVALLFCAIAGGLLELVFFINKERCKADHFCPFYFDDIIRVWAPVGALVSLHIVSFVWVHVAALAFPRASGKPSERFCAPLSPTGRAACYFFSLAGIIALSFFAFWVPIAITFTHQSDSLSLSVSVFIAIIAGPLFACLALIPVIIFLSFLCCRCSCIEKTFDDHARAHANYSPIQGY
jgi:hypothetical protein